MPVSGTTNAFQLTRRMQTSFNSAIGLYTVHVYYVTGYLDTSVVPAIFTPGSFEKYYQYAVINTAEVASPPTALGVTPNATASTLYVYGQTFGTAYTYPQLILPDTETDTGFSQAQINNGPTTLDSTHTVTVTLVGTTQTGVTHRNIYRRAGSTLQPFLLVATIADANTTTTWTDNGSATTGRQPPAWNQTRERVRDGYNNAKQAVAILEGLNVTSNYGQINSGAGADAIYGGDPP